MTTRARGQGEWFDPFVAWCAAHGLPVPEREYPFATSRGRKFLADYCWPDRLIVEKDGGTWTTGGHSTGKGIQRDMEKGNLAQLMGYRFLRYTPQQLCTPQTLAELKEALGC